jgi:hypothetical protein
MALKRVPNPEQVPEQERVRRDDIMGRLCIFTLKAYNPAHIGQYGTGPRAVADVFDVADQRVGRGLYLHGNAGRQLGEALQPGEEALGRLVKGTMPDGRTFVGIDFAEEESEFAAAEAARASA